MTSHLPGISEYWGWQAHCYFQSKHRKKVTSQLGSSWLIVILLEGLHFQILPSKWPDHFGIKGMIILFQGKRKTIFSR